MATGSRSRWTGSREHTISNNDSTSRRVTTFGQPPSTRAEENRSVETHSPQTETEQGMLTASSEDSGLPVEHRRHAYDDEEDEYEGRRQRSYHGRRSQSVRGRSHPGRDLHQHQRQRTEITGARSLFAALWRWLLQNMATIVIVTLLLVGTVLYMDRKHYQEKMEILVAQNDLNLQMAKDEVKMIAEEREKETRRWEAHTKNIHKQKKQAVWRAYRLENEGLVSKIWNGIFGSSTSQRAIGYDNEDDEFS